MREEGKFREVTELVYLLCNVLDCEGEDQRTNTPEAPVFVEVHQDGQQIENIAVGEANQTVRLCLDSPDSMVHLRVM